MAKTKRKSGKAGASKGASGGGTKAASKPAEKVGPFEFIAQTRQEASKVTWTTWPETWKTALMVLFVMVLFGAFFFVVDGALGALTKWALSFGSA